MSWTAERDEYLRSHYKLNGSASEIGAALGVSRNAIIGRARRIGLVADSGRGRDEYPKGQHVIAFHDANPEASKADAARAAGCSWRYVNYIARKYGLIFQHRVDAPRPRYPNIAREAHKRNIRYRDLLKQLLAAVDKGAGDLVEILLDEDAA